MRNKPSVSIIIPAFNEEKFISKLLRSIKDQSLRPLEVIVADANSSDKTVETSKQYGAKVVKGGKPATGRNNGAKVAKGEILVFLDADVTLPKNFLEETTKEFLLNNYESAVCGMNVLSEKYFDLLIQEIGNLGLLLTSYSRSPKALGACIFVTKKGFNKVRGFNEELVLAEDHDFVKRLKNVGKNGYLHSARYELSMRRYQKEGRIKVLLKYLLMGVYMFFRGEIKRDVIRYEFGHYEEKKGDNGTIDRNNKPNLLKRGVFKFTSEFFTTLTKSLKKIFDKLF